MSSSEHFFHLQRSRCRCGGGPACSRMLVFHAWDMCVCLCRQRRGYRDHQTWYPSSPASPQYLNETFTNCYNRQKTWKTYTAHMQYKHTHTHVHSCAPGTGSYKLVELNGPCIFYIEVINLAAHIQISPFLYSRTTEVTERSSSRGKSREKISNIFDNYKRNH